MKELIELPSVGTWLDPVNGNVFPMNADGTPDWESPIHFSEIEAGGDWWNALSPADLEVVEAAEIHYYLIRK